MSLRRVPKFQVHNIFGSSQRRTSLVQVVLIMLLITSMLPVLIVGSLTFIRSRTMLRNQVEKQMESVATKNLESIRSYIQTREQMMDTLASDPLFLNYLNIMVTTDPTSPEFTNARSAAFMRMTIFFDYRTWAQTGTTGFFDEMIIVQPDGQLLVESTSNWTLQNFGRTKIADPFILSLIGTSQSLMTYNAVPNLSANQVAVYSTRSFRNDKGELIATMIASGSNITMYRTLNDSRDFFLQARALYFTPQLHLIGPDDVENRQRIIDVTSEPSFNTPLMGTIQSGKNSTFFGATNQSGKPVQVFAKWLPEYQMGFLIELPDEVVFSHWNFFDPVNIAILGASIFISGILIYFGTTRLVNPLVHLAKVAEDFSKGNWNERANIHRTDEIGLVANAFNHMADDLSEMYHSLEQVVEKRTSQIRTAAEVAQLATSTSDLDETLSRTVNLLAERFGYYHVALYLVDESGRFLTMSKVGGVAASEILARNDRVDMVNNSLVGWVATNNRSRIITNVETDDVFRPNSLLPETTSEVGIPISTGTEVLGVLDIQSAHRDTFDQETVTVLQALANQISGSLQNTRLLETTQVSYKETSLLYRITRQVAQAQTENEVVQILSDSFIQLPYITLVMSVQEDQFKVLVVTDARTGRVDRNLINITIPVKDMGQRLLENRVHLIDIGKPSEFDNILTFLFRRGCKTAALLSIVENNKLSMVLALGSREADAITHTSLQPYANLADVIGTTLEKYRMVTTLQFRLSELQILANVGQTLTTETHLDRLFRALHEQVMQVLGPTTNFAIALYNAQKNLIEFPYRSVGDQQAETLDPMPLGEGLTSSILKERKPLLLVKDTEQSVAALGGKIVGKAARSWMGIPLIFANEIVGAIIVQDLENENAFDTSDLNLFMTIAPQVATAIRNAQLLNETQEALKAYHLEHFLLNSLLDNTPDAMAFKDLEGRYIRASQSVASVYQVDLSSLSGKTDFDLFDQHTAERIGEMQKHVLESGQAETEVFSQKLPSGQDIWWQFSSIPMYEADNTPYGLLVIQRNITEVKKAEALAERRAEQVLIAAEIARDTTGTLDLQALQEKSVNLVRERFGFYHSSIFTLDPLREYAILRQSTGPAGEQMMRNGHRLAVGSKSIVGQVISQQKALIVNDVTQDPNYYPNPLLPETRSEMAIPLKVNDQILGALDVQSRQVNAFTEEDINVLQILADQLAVALINADLFAKTQELLGKHRLLRQVTVAANTSTTLEDALVNVVSGLRTSQVGDRIAIMMVDDEGNLVTRASAGFEGTRHLELRVKIGEGITGLAAAEKRPVRVDNTLMDSRYITIDPDVRSELAIPILFSDELMGVLNLESTEVSAFDENDQEILGALGNNLGGVIANIRLVQQVSKQVERERLLFDVTSKIRHSVDLETILQTSTREICRAIGARKATIHITAGSSLDREAMNAAPQPPSPKLPGENGNGSSGLNGRSNGASHKDNGGEVKP